MKNKDKSKRMWTGFSIGMIIGIGYGMTFDTLTNGIVVGLCFGVV